MWDFLTKKCGIFGIEGGDKIVGFSASRGGFSPFNFWPHCLFIFVNKYFAFFNLILKLHWNSNEKMNFWTNFTFWIVLALCVSQGIFNRNSTFIDGKNSNSNQMILYLFLISGTSSKFQLNWEKKFRQNICKLQVISNLNLLRRIPSYSGRIVSKNLYSFRIRDFVCLPFVFKRVIPMD